MSRLLYGPWVDDADVRGIRLIGYDRPGYARSTPQPGRSVGDAAEDVATIADALEIERFGTWGISGGGPHALACAALLPGRVVAAGALASVAPYDAEGLDYLAGMGEANIVEFHAVLEGRNAIEPLAERDAASLRTADAAGLRHELESLLSPVDAAALAGELAEYMVGAMREGLRVCVDGWIDDDIAFVQPWGFDVGQISVPVLVWHGKEDRFAPFAHGAWLAARIPAVEARLTPTDGHLTVLENAAGVHEWLLAQAR
ncbi:MAG: alpha/beta hydrolase [Actinobacteria bacterium]|nr:MAG: alpha/beta hydrolase [Actinomycetota bacterium]